MNETLRIVAEFVDRASQGLQRAGESVNNFTSGVRQSAAAQTAATAATRAGAAASAAAVVPMGALVTAIGGMVAGLGLAALATQAFVNAIQNADRLDDLADKTKMAASQLRELEFAAKQSGTTLEAVIQAMNKIGEAADKAADPTSEQARTFKQLGIEVKTAGGELKSTEQLFNEAADRLSRIKDGPEKSAAAMRIFGEEAKKLGPLLNQGSEGIKKLREEAAALSMMGPEAFDDFAKSSARLNDNFDKLLVVSDGFFSTLAADLLPTLNIVIEQFISSAKEGGVVRSVMDGLAWVFRNTLVPALRFSAEAISEVVSVLKIAGMSIGAVMAAIATVASGGGVAGLKSVWSSYTDDVKAVNKEHGEFVKRLDTAGHEAARLVDRTKPAQESIRSLGKEAKATTGELDKFIKKMNDARYTYDIVPDNADALDAARARDIWEQTAALQKDIAAGMERSAALRKYAEADAKSSLQDENRRYQAGIKALDAADLEYKVKERELAQIKFENSLVGKSADERERLIQARKDEFALNKQWADTVAGNEAMADSAWEVTKMIQARSAALKKASDDAAIQNEIFDNSIAQAQENFTRRILLAVQMYEAGKISLADFTAFQQQEYDSLLNKTKDTTEKSKTFWEEAAKGMQDSMQTFFYDIMQGNMTNIVDDFQKMISKMVAQALAAKLGEKLFGAGFEKTGSVSGGWLASAASWFGNMFGGARALGGPVSAGKAYIVGENRPELFVPDTSGTILPSTDMLGNAGVTVQMHVSAVDTQSFLGAMNNVKRDVATMIYDATRQYNLGR